MIIPLKRAYEPPEPSDGFRILVDRLWPRGLSKNSVHIDLWFREIAPSTSLRKWFDHDSLKWAEFRERYFLELQNNSKAVDQLTDFLHRGVITLVYGAKDKEHNHAIVLKEHLGNLNRHS